MRNRCAQPLFCQVLKKLYCYVLFAADVIVAKDKVTNSCDDNGP